MTGPNGSSCLITVATCNLNQWALDFEGNASRILESCLEAKKRGAIYRLGPELEISGYGCEDHFLESDTFAHCWESLAWLLSSGATDDLLCDFGMPVLYSGTRFNCRILVKDRRILLIRPKTIMADSGNYRESRYFTPYNNKEKKNTVSQFVLPKVFQDEFQQVYAPFGSVYIEFQDGITIGCESCEELWTPNATHIDLALQGVEIIGNGSGSHHELRKLDTRIQLIQSATKKSGGIYLYANQRGCDGGRCYFDGGSLIVCNGEILAQASQFSLNDVEVVTATIDLDDVRSYRAAIASFGVQTVTSSLAETQRSFVNCKNDLLPESALSPSLLQLRPTKPINQVRIHTPEEECCLGPACWLWDYLRRSGASGYFLPLSGGADSSSVAAIVGVMCNMVVKTIQTNTIDNEANVKRILEDCRRICRKTLPDDGKDVWVPQSSNELANYILHTAYMGTKNSSNVTYSRAKRLGEAIGSYHSSIQIDYMVEAVIKVFTMTTNCIPRFVINGGTQTEDLALQNIQARLRMVTAYLFAQLLPWVRKQGSGFLLVLGSANVDEGLRGYMTKYDCSSADLNPIGAISKNDLKSMLLYASKEYNYPVLEEIASAPPTAELRPIVKDTNEDNNDGIEKDEEKDTAEHSQLDEEEMGMTYYELGLFGKLRKISRCGPVSMFRKLCYEWYDRYSVDEIAAKVKRFFFYYSINRHKMCTITPSYHAEQYSPDDNRFDLRPFLYNVKWTRQFQIIDKLVQKELQQKQSNE